MFSSVFGLKGKIRLPNTKIICDNSNHRMVITDINENSGHGVSPDFNFQAEVVDVIHQNDVGLNFVLNSIIGKN